MSERIIIEPVGDSLSSKRLGGRHRGKRQKRQPRRRVRLWWRRHRDQISEATYGTLLFLLGGVVASLIWLSLLALDKIPVPTPGPTPRPVVPAPSVTPSGWVTITPSR